MSATSTIAKHAKPAALCLMVTGKDLANWWTWRLQTPMPLWKGLRMGYRGKATRRDEVEAWQFEDFGSCSVKSLAYIYPAQKSGIMCVSVGPPKWIPSQANMLTDAFEADLFGELPAAPPERRWGAVFRRSRPPLAMWNGKAWATRSDAATPCRIHVANGTRAGLHMTWGGRTYNSVQVSPQGKAMRVVMDFGRSNGGLLWIRPKPDASTPQSLMAVLLEHRADYTVPHIIELRLQEEAPR